MELALSFASSLQKAVDLNLESEVCDAPSYSVLTFKIIVLIQTGEFGLSHIEDNHRSSGVQS